MKGLETGKPKIPTIDDLLVIPQAIVNIVRDEYAVNTAAHGE